MSEHMSINGTVDYLHLPYGDEGAFTFCNHCKQTCERVNVEFHEGLLDDWMNVVCTKCKKSLWTARLKRKQTKDNKKCVVCGKPTNHFYCEAYGGRMIETGTSYWCSKKCNDEGNELFFKEDEVINEINLCCEEQKIEIDLVNKIKLVRRILG